MENTVACRRRNIIDKCEKLLFDRLINNNISIDPLISDHHCEIHSLLLIQIFVKCFNSERHTYDIEKLHAKDIEILSYAFLLSVLKVEYKDKFGFVIHQESINSLGGKMVLSKKQENKFLADVKKKFNEESIKFVREVAILDLKTILRECSASVTHNHTKFNLLPCYATIYAMLVYMRENDLPIIIVLTRVTKMGQGDAIRYGVTSRDVLYCKWQGNILRQKITLNDFDKIRPAIGITCHSITGFESDDDDFVSKFRKYIDGTEFPSKDFMKNCDIGHLLMISAANHLQLSDSKALVVPTGFHNQNEYINYTFEKFSDNATIPTYTLDSNFDFTGTNIFHQFIAHYKLGQELHLDQNYCTWKGRKVTRSVRNTFFAASHMYVTNFLEEYRSGNFLHLNDTLGRVDIVKLSGNEADEACTILELE